MTQALTLVYRVSYQVTEVWKLTKTAERLVEQFMVRVESCSTFDGAAN